MKNIHFVIQITLVLLLCNVAAAAPRRALQDLHFTLPGVYCNGAGQRCSSKYRRSVRTKKILKFQFTASRGHCSSIKIIAYLDGKRVKRTPPLAPGESSKLFTVKSLRPGRHQLSLRAVGVAGGCNLGTLGAWTGSLLVKL